MRTGATGVICACFSGTATTGELASEESLEECDAREGGATDGGSPQKVKEVVEQAKASRPTFQGLSLGGRLMRLSRRYMRPPVLRDPWMD